MTRLSTTLPSIVNIKPLPLITTLPTAPPLIVAVTVTNGRARS